MDRWFALVYTRSHPRILRLAQCTHKIVNHGLSCWIFNVQHALPSTLTMRTLSWVDIRGHCLEKCWLFDLWSNQNWEEYKCFVPVFYSMTDDSGFKKLVFWTNKRYQRTIITARYSAINLKQVPSTNIIQGCINISFVILTNQSLAGVIVTGAWLIKGRFVKLQIRNKCISWEKEE